MVGEYAVRHFADRESVCAEKSSREKCQISGPGLSGIVIGPPIRNHWKTFEVVDGEIQLHPLRNNHRLDSRTMPFDSR